jgi:hypothetical protein
MTPTGDGSTQEGCSWNVAATHVSLSSVKFGFEFAFDIYNGVNLAHRVYWGIWADASEYAEIEC